METSGQLHTPKKRSPGTTEKQAVWTPEQSEYPGEEANLLPVLGRSQFKAIKVYMAA